MTLLGDRELALRCADGEEPAWDEFLQRFDRRVLLVLLRAGIGEPELSDLRQEVYARLLTARGAALRTLRAENEGALGAFVAQVALRVAIDYARSRGTRSKREVDENEASELPGPRDSPEEALAQKERRALFAKALLTAAQGPQIERDLTVLRAHFVDGFNAQEIAVMGCGLSAKGVETLVRRARLQIEAELSASVRAVR